MNDGPRMDPVPEHERDSSPGDPPTTLGVIGGILLGIVGGLALSFFSTLLFSDLASVDLPFAVILVLPVAVGLIMLAVPSWRRAGAGFVMGLAIGSIASAGVCGAFFAWLNTSLG